MPKKAIYGPCRVIGCGRALDVHGMCGKHYRMHRLYGRTQPTRTGDKFKHPLYRLWYERLDRGSLCPEWRDDFWAMVSVVGERPSQRHFLSTPTLHQPYGPENWEWKEFLKRREGESAKEWHARKWQSRRKSKPRAEHHRHLVRRFGISSETYEAMLAAQGGVCAICRTNDTHLLRGRKVNLAVDHDHSTGAVRDLLCFACNSAVGQLKESVDLAKALQAYLEKWQSPETPARDLIPMSAREGIIITPDGPLTVTEAARAAGLRPSTVLSRIRHGWPQEDLLKPLKRVRRLVHKGA